MQFFKPAPCSGKSLLRVARACERICWEGSTSVGDGEVCKLAIAAASASIKFGVWASAIEREDCASILADGELVRGMPV